MEVVMEKRILYFDKPGKHNTDETFDLVRERAKELDIRQVVVASTHGYTAKSAAAALKDLGLEIIAVSICAGFDKKGWTMSTEERRELEGAGITVLTCMHALGDDVNDAFGGAAPNRVVRETLYRFSQGMKVAVEISLMAADAGLIDISREVIAVGGSSEGADTAIVVKPAFTKDFKSMEIREILAKPRSG
jgi:hypothetical protein